MIIGYTRTDEIETDELFANLEPAEKIRLIMELACTLDDAAIVQLREKINSPLLDS